MGDQFAAAIKSVESVPAPMPTESPKSSSTDSSSEIKKLKAQMEQMKLAHERQLAEEKQKLQLAQEQQLRAAAEEKRRLEAEKQAEIERIKTATSNRIKTRQKDLKYESPVQPPKSTPPLPPVSQTIRQTLMPGPKPKASPEQLKLQDQLIAACKQGDEKAVKRYSNKARNRISPTLKVSSR